ncbi:hypothetical protein [Microbacterium sp. RU33B]|uniref:hypothetical protein n=1 Tax=Microbacterium sp. RU33B TaxID=1907390 RepID=UPI00096423EF|nr:hypothetical protein [Microbacterium sp. RU33B]SIT85823.1 hypothetical protein SAMN05880545_2401 [Microbacterium sp. RU33B]
MIEELRNLARDLNSAIQKNAGFQALTASHPPVWYGRMLSELTLAVEGLAVEHLSARYGDRKGQVVVLTEHLVIESLVAKAKDDDADFVTNVYPRSSLQSVRLVARGSVFEQDAFAEWPGAVSLILRYQEAGRLELPLDGPGEPETMRSLYTSLRNDLASTIEH